jgi:hypothetical protein
MLVMLSFISRHMTQKRQSYKQWQKNINRRQIEDKNKVARSPLAEQ